MFWNCKNLILPAITTKILPFKGCNKMVTTPFLNFLAVTLSSF